MATQKSAKRTLIPLPNIPQEIITEILLRLPVKSLLKFRCVSKSFLSIISSSQFIKTHLKISTNNNIFSHQRLIFGSGARPTVFYNFPLYPKVGEDSSMDTVSFDYHLSEPDDGIRIVGSCNGLICVALDPFNIILWNPATRKSRMLPVSCKNISGMRYGFGYDVSNDDYKVVEFSWISRDPGVFETQLHVYSLRNDSWKKGDCPEGKIFDDPGVFVNGSIHWKVYYNDNPRDWNVIAQNVTTEKFGIVALPTCGSGHEDVMLGVSGGRFCAFYDYLSYMDVWVLKEYDVRDSWSKLVCFPYYLCTRHLDHVRPKLLFVWDNGGILLKLGLNFIMYKPSRYHEILRLSDDIEVEAATYSESLIFPYFDPVDWR